MNDILRDRFDELSERVEEVIADVKPRLRGWLHPATAPSRWPPASCWSCCPRTPRPASGRASSRPPRWSCSPSPRSITAALGSPTVHSRLKRFDHSNIFLLIAGSCTPFALLLLDGTNRWAMLAIVWGGAIGGVFMKVVWKGAPRWLSAPIYMALGWAPVFFFGDFVSGAAANYGAGVGTAVIVLVATGGGLYTLGGIVYGTKFPNPWPRWFGFHEVFHTFTIPAFVTHYVGVSLATYSLR
ncbi:PAQR family membrane homeostasis protein TrhA [Nocardioides sp. B-3]|uniref:PAQR family membrane homeostasis protein TrhA n=1 Tax=Nocardioides sp. B-3 TaxID=2895565 RepID=UPI002152F5D9|nr:hemolysin III family protein [Nocardioides sp. B-3]UUZ60279.1 hemolysin III family protein [Nocardioides sp. B-3]